MLCRSCARDVPPCEGLIQDHIRSNVTDAEAWLVDGFGAAHAIGEKTTIGRNHDGDLMVLAASVSREHAELRSTDGGWTVRDLGSRNGTFVDGQAARGRVVLPPRAVLKVGDVPMWFLAEVIEEPAASPVMETASVGGVVRFALQHTACELCLVGGGDGGAGGTLLSRATGTEKWENNALPPLEFQLLRVLCARAVVEADSPAEVRGCIATKQLAKDLPFQSKYANEENVRQVVSRLRGALAEVGARGILAVQPGRGYYITCPVTVSSRGA